MKKKSKVIQAKIDIITRGLKECTSESAYKSMWNQRLDLKEELEMICACGANPKMEESEVCKKCL